MYTVYVRRIQLYIDPQIDDLLRAVAARRGISRSAFVRSAVRSALAKERRLSPDPLDALVGSVAVTPDDDLDEAIYELDR